MECDSGGAVGWGIIMSGWDTRIPPFNRYNVKSVWCGKIIESKCEFEQAPEYEHNTRRLQFFCWINPKANTSCISNWFSKQTWRYTEFAKPNLNADLDHINRDRYISQNPLKECRPLHFVWRLASGNLFDSFFRYFSTQVALSSCQLNCFGQVIETMSK